MTQRPQMRIKSFFAKSVDQAMADARAELGSEALLLNTRRVPATEAGGGGYEVVLGVSGDAPELNSSSAEVPEKIPRTIPAPMLEATLDATQAASQAAQAAARVTASVASGGSEPLFAAPKQRGILKDTSTDIPKDSPQKLFHKKEFPPKDSPKDVFKKEEMQLVAPRETPAAGSRLAPAVETKAAAKPVANAALHASTNAGNSAPDQLAVELLHLHNQMDEIHGLLARSSRTRMTTIGRSVPEVADIHARLLAADVEPALAQEIVGRLERSLGTDANVERSGGQRSLSSAASRPGVSRVETLLRAELESCVGLAPRLGVETGSDLASSSVVALVGPRGAGKTTSLAKLAVSATRFASTRRARMLSLDVARATAHLQLQSVASTYQIAFQQVPADYLLPQLIADVRDDETVFIDTPGYTGAEASAAATAAAAFEQCPGLDVHLVVPGYMKARDLRDCIERYSAFRPSKLLVTKLDETQALGSIFSEAARAGLKLSFLCYGPGIPHDLRPASSEDLLGLAVDRLNIGRMKARAQHVA